jgi:hypothetical protein
MITITSPIENQQFILPDSVLVIADISDDKKITNLMVGLCNSDFISVIPMIYFYPESSEYHLEMQMVIDNADLATGDYYLFIRAEDEEGFKNEYLMLQIVGIPKELEGIIVLTEMGNAEIGIFAIEPEGDTEFLFEVSSDFSSSEIDSKNRMLYISGIDMYDITAFNIDTKQMEWQREAFPPLPMHAPNCSFFDEILYISYATNFIFGFRYNGSLVFNTTIEESKLPSRLVKYEDYLIADLQSKTGGLMYLATYYLVSGAEKQRMNIDYKVVDFLNTGAGNCLIIANVNEIGTLRLYNPYQNVESFLLDTPERIVSSARINDSNYIIGLENSVYAFDLSQNSLVNIFPGQASSRIRFDPINQMIFITGYHIITIISYPELQIQNTIPLQDSILNMHLFYNK